MEDALESLASIYKLIWPNHQPSIEIMHFDEPAHCLTTTKELDDKSCFYDIKRYLEKQEYPTDVSSLDKRNLRRLDQISS